MGGAGACAHDEEISGRFDRKPPFAEYPAENCVAMCLGK